MVATIMKLWLFAACELSATYPHPHNVQPTCFHSFWQRPVHGHPFEAELRSAFNLNSFKGVALRHKLSSSYLCKKLYFFGNHSINMWLRCIPWSFHCEKADSLLIRPKGDWSCAFAYSTSAMNYRTLVYGIIELTLHNHVPIIQVFIWAVNSQHWLSRTTLEAKQKKKDCASAHLRKRRGRCTHRWKVFLLFFELKHSVYFTFILSTSLYLYSCCCHPAMLWLKKQQGCCLGNKA